MAIIRTLENMQQLHFINYYFTKNEKTTKQYWADTNYICLYRELAFWVLHVTFLALKNYQNTDIYLFLVADVWDIRDLCSCISLTTRLYPTCFILDMTHKIKHTMYARTYSWGAFSNRCCCWKAVSVTNYECVFVALLIQHSKNMGPIIMSSVTCLIVPIVLHNLINGAVLGNTYLK
jgi:hypothetical protein